jgi:pimeloyl-ACP methyl ester carboxylesterase
VAAHQRWDLLDPVLATGTLASLSQEAAPRPVRALARRGSGTSPGRWLYTLPGVAIIHSRHRKMQIPYLARHGRVVTFDGRGNGRSDLRRPGYQRGHRGTPRQARLTGRRT